MTTATGSAQRIDIVSLEEKVKAMYRDVALDPHGEFHFEMGRALAERLGYAPADLEPSRPKRSTRLRASATTLTWLTSKPGERVRRSRQRVGDGQLHRRRHRSATTGR